METFHVPKSADSQPVSLTESGALPSFTLDSVFAIAALRTATGKQKYSALGVVAAIFNDNDEILIIEHNRSDKYPLGALGPIAETSAAYMSDKSTPLAESVSQTLARAFYEELSLRTKVAFMISKSAQTWIKFDWPTGSNRPDESRYAVCPILRSLDPETLTKDVMPNQEVLSARFYPLDRLRTASSLRTGVENWLDEILNSEAYRLLPHSFDSRSENPVFHSTPSTQADLTDLVFDSPEYITLAQRNQSHHVE